MSKARGDGVLEAAGVGHRITHSDVKEPRDLMSAAIVHASAGLGGKTPRAAALGAQMAGFVGAPLLGAATVKDEAEECPSPCGELALGSENTFMGQDRRMVALAIHDDHKHPCERHTDGPVMTGTLDVWVNKMPWARRSDPTDCGALIGEGEPTVLIGPQTAGEPAPPPDQTTWNQSTTRGAMQASGRRDSRGTAGPITSAEMAGGGPGVGGGRGRRSQGVLGAQASSLLAQGKKGLQGLLSGWR